MPLPTSVPRGIKLTADRAVNLFVLPLIKDAEQHKGRKTSADSKAFFLSMPDSKIVDNNYNSFSNGFYVLQCCMLPLISLT